MDTMALTKIVGSLCGALLILLLLKWGAETLYHVGGSGHGDEHAAYIIEVDEGGHEEAVDAGPSVVELMASADLAKGEKMFGKCKACHKLGDGENGTGPSLFGIVGRDIGSLAAFGYSGIMTELPGNWEPSALDAFLTKPKSYAPGTKMTFGGLKKPQDRANLIAFLQSVGG